MNSLRQRNIAFYQLTHRGRTFPCHRRGHALGSPDGTLQRLHLPSNPISHPRCRGEQQERLQAGPKSLKNSSRSAPTSRETGGQTIHRSLNTFSFIKILGVGQNITRFKKKKKIHHSHNAKLSATLLSPKGIMQVLPLASGHISAQLAHSVFSQRFPPPCFCPPLTPCSFLLPHPLAPLSPPHTRLPLELPDCKMLIFQVCWCVFNNVGMG